MIFEGPSAPDFRNRVFEHGAVEAWMGSDWDNRVRLWVFNAPFVKGKPEWGFVKVYTHGVQSRSTILGEKFTNMIRELSKLSKEKDFRLHFVTAREAYNIVKAAERGERGDPEEYRDYEKPKPINRVLRVDQQFEHLRFGADCIEITPKLPGPSSYEFNQGPIISVAGNLESITLVKRQGVFLAYFSGHGAAVVISRVPLDFSALPKQSFIEEGRYNYEIQLGPTMITCDMKFEN